MSLRGRAESVLRRAGFGRDPIEKNGLPIEATSADLSTLLRARPFTMTSDERVWSLINAVRYIVSNQIEGDFVECGVWRGGSAMVMSLTLADLGADRQIWLYDTFEGMTPPTSVDVEASTGKTATSLLERTRKAEGDSVWCLASLDDVQANMASTGVAAEHVIFKVGDVATTLQQEPPTKIALLRLDTDWYESTKVELEVLYPRLVSGGVCLIDDYGYWAGARRAVDEYFATMRPRPLMHRIDPTGRAFIKP
jgi:O-methyltransferase